MMWSTPALRNAHVSSRSAVLGGILEKSFAGVVADVEAIAAVVVVAKRKGKERA